MSERHACLHPCPSCTRHVRSSESACPFCDAALPGKCVLPHAAPVGHVANRAVLAFVAATTIAACGKTTKTTEEQPPMTVYGPPPMDIDAGAPEISDAGIAPAPVDASKDRGK